MNIGEKIDKLRENRDQQRELNDQLTALKTAYTELEEQIIQELKEQGNQTARTDRATATHSEREIPVVDDWEAVYDYMYENNAGSLLQRRLAVNAVNDWLETMGEIPGVRIIKKDILSLRSRNG